MITTVEAATATRSAGRVRGTDESYAALKALVAGRGLLERCPRAQLRPAAGHLALFATTVAGVALMRGGWWVLLWTLPAALLVGQLGFLAHDAAHNQILRTSRGNYARSVALFNLCVGGSRGWWAERHTTHHAQPNRAGIDPDIEGGLVAVWSGQARQARGFTRFMIGQQARRRPAGDAQHVADARRQRRFPAQSQAAQPARGARAHARALRGVRRWAGRDTRGGRGLAFVTVHQLLLGIYPGAAFLPNHTGMAVIEDGEPLTGGATRRVSGAWSSSPAGRDDEQSEDEEHGGLPLQ